MEALSRYLRAMPGFLSGMPPALIAALCRRASYQQLPAGQPLFQQGDVGQAMYLVLEGECSLFKRFDGMAPERPSSAGTLPQYGCGRRLHA